MLSKRERILSELELHKRELHERELRLRLRELSELDLSELELHERELHERELRLRQLELSELELSELELSELELSTHELRELLAPRETNWAVGFTLYLKALSRVSYVLFKSGSKQTLHDPNIDLTGGFVEFLLRVVLKHDDLDDQLNSLEEAYVIDVLRFGSKHPWWGVCAARFHLYWWALIIFTKEGIAMSPAGKLVRSVVKKWGF